MMWNGVVVTRIPSGVGNGPAAGAGGSAAAHVAPPFPPEAKSSFQALLDILIGAPTIPNTNYQFPSTFPNTSTPSRVALTGAMQEQHRLPIVPIYSNAAPAATVAPPEAAVPSADMAINHSVLPSLSMLGSMGLSACLSLCLSIPRRITQLIWEPGSSEVPDSDPPGSHS